MHLLGIGINCNAVTKGYNKENPMGFGLFELNIPIGEWVGGGGGYGAIVYMAVTGRGLGKCTQFFNFRGGTLFLALF